MNFANATIMSVFLVIVAMLLACSVSAQDWQQPLPETWQQPEYEWMPEPEAVPAEPTQLLNDTIVFAAASCSLRLNFDVGRPTPLILYPRTTRSWRASNANGLLTFSGGQEVQLACPGKGNYIVAPGQSVSVATQEAIITCAGGTKFKHNGRTPDFKQLVCKRWPEHATRVAGSCLWGKTLLKTGFRVNAGLIDLYDTCHDQQLHHTYYTKLVLGKDAAGFQEGVPRPEWEKGTFFKGVDITNLYRRVTQRVTFTKLLGSQQLANRFVSLTNDHFLSKGHLVAKADFMHGAHQMATFMYTNAAPQWQTFNGGNWNALENDVRSFAGRKKKDFDCYTGTYGRSDLPDVHGRSVDIYLTPTARAPAPRMFWKILYDPKTHAGIAFVGLNNPYQTAAEAAKDVRCKDICKQVKWLTWNQSHLVRGYSYCCEVNDFRRNFPDVPTFPVTSILK